MSDETKTDPYDADKPGFVLKPCPFCGSKAIQKAPRQNWPVTTLCLDCCAEGPEKLTGREADTAWNNRSDPVENLDAVTKERDNWKRVACLFETSLKADISGDTYLSEQCHISAHDLLEELRKVKA